MWQMSTGIAQSNTRARSKGHGQSHEPGHHGEKERLGRRALDTSQNSTKLRSELGVTARAGRLPKGLVLLWSHFSACAQSISFLPPIPEGLSFKVYIPIGSVSWHHLVGLN